MKTINTLINEFKSLHGDVHTNTERNEIVQELVKKHGYDKVSQATGYKPSTLVAVMSQQKVLLADVRIRQAVYVFKNLNVE